MRIRIEGTDLPGHRDLHVGVQRGTEVVEQISTDTPEVTWEFEITSRDVDGSVDVGGPWVHGRRGERFLYLCWGTKTGDRFVRSGRTKLMFGDVPADALHGAHDGAGVLVGRVGLTDSQGSPRYARIPAPDLAWALE